MAEAPITGQWYKCFLKEGTGKLNKWVLLMLQVELMEYPRKLHALCVEQQQVMYSKTDKFEVMPLYFTVVHPTHSVCG